MSTTRRQRRIAGHIEQVIRELALKDYSTAQIAADLERRREKVPDARTIRSIVAEVAPPDPSDGWTLRAANADDVALVMPVVQAVIERTEGRRSKLTMAEAAWVARLRRAAPDLPLWNTYVLARLYVGAERLAQPTEHLDTLVAFAPWRGRTERGRYFKAERRLRIELLGVVPELLSGPDAPIRMTPTGPGEWAVGVPAKRAAAQKRKVTSGKTRKR